MNETLAGRKQLLRVWCYAFLVSPPSSSASLILFFFAPLYLLPLIPISLPPFWPALVYFSGTNSWNGLQVHADGCFDFSLAHRDCSFFFRTYIFTRIYSIKNVGFIEVFRTFVGESMSTVGKLILCFQSESRLTDTRQSSRVSPVSRKLRRS